MKKLKNKFLTVLLFALLILPCMLIVTACGAEHKAVGEWSTSDTKHWHTCVVEDCEEKFEEADHTINADTNTCDVCGYKKHEAKSEWMKNDTKHWHNCKIADCEEKFNEADHTINSETNICDVCGYEKHEVANDTWLSDADKHWHGCKVEGCTEKYDEADHSFDAESHICLCGEAEGTMTVKVKTGDAFKAYATIEEAIAGAENGSTIVLLKNIENLSSVLTSEKSLTYDLNGKTITGNPNNTHSRLETHGTAMFYFGDRESAQTSVIKNGKLVYNCLKTANLIQNCKDSTLLIEDVTIEANENVNTIYTDSNAVTTIKNCVINTASTVLATNNTYGAPAGQANIVNIENSTLTSTGDSALFASCYQIYNIVNSTITGHYSAMHIMMGKINIDKDSTLACTMEKASLKTVDRLKDQGSGEEPEDGVAIVVRADLYYDASAKTNNLEINIEEGAKLISKSLDNDESEFKANIIVYNCNNAKGYLTDKENVVNQYEKAKEAFATRTDVVYYVLSGDILAEEATTAE